MHRAGRICRNVFDVDLLACADVAAAIAVALRQHGAQCVKPSSVLELEIDETRTRNIDLLDQRIDAKFVGDLVGEVARLDTGLLGKNHRRICRHIAMRRILRRLDDHTRQIDVGGKCALSAQHATHRMDAQQHVGKQMR